MGLSQAVACLLILSSFMSEEINLKLMKLIEKNPHLTQRELASAMGMSLGKTHYVLKSLVNVGWVKLSNFRKSNNKLGYAYILTPLGVVEKVAITARFLLKKQNEYESLKKEIEELKAEVNDLSRSVMLYGLLLVEIKIKYAE